MHSKVYRDWPACRQSYGLIDGIIVSRHNTDRILHVICYINCEKAAEFRALIVIYCLSTGYDQF